MTPLLPENAGCPQCGSIEGRRWRSYSGIELCTDCEWDFLSTLNERKLLDAEQELTRPRTLPKASRPPSQVRHKSARTDPAGGTSKRPWGGDSDALGRGLGHRSPTGSNSICRSCGHIYYSQILERCLRCRGLCEHRSDHDLTLMGRYAQRFIEAER